MAKGKTASAERGGKTAGEKGKTDSWEVLSGGVVGLVVEGSARSFWLSEAYQGSVGDEGRGTRGGAWSACKGCEEAIRGRGSHPRGGW